ncbi:MAG: ADP-ribosylglycohydrolase family protein [Clostridiales bacterium]|nr:ADP-ribosylglycohydrolase family protein [Clostridiales bacterium]
MILAFNDYKDKVLGCWWGKTAGGTLGAPYECFRGVVDLNGYTQEDPSGIPNDDLDLQLMILRACEKYGMRIDSHILGEFWLTYMSASMSEYGAAKSNLRSLVPPPLSGSLHNPNKSSCGSYIRSEIWACLCAGYPELAVRYAVEDAMVDHGAEGVYAEAFCAAVQSAAFVESDVFKLLDKGLSFIPEDCGVARAVRCVVECYRSGKTWREARKILLKTEPGSFGMILGYYPGQKPEKDVPVGEHGYDAPSNVAIGVIGLLYGEKDFGKTICIAAGCMEDADCTAGFAGATLGIINGRSGLDKKWLEPLGNKIATWCLRIDIDLQLPKTIEELTERVLRLTPIFLGSEIVNTFCKGEGYELETGRNVLYSAHVTDQLGVPEFSAILSRVPDCVRYQGILFDTYVRYDGGCEISLGEPKKAELTFWNKLLDQQWLDIKWHTPDGVSITPNKNLYVSLDQKHGGFNIGKAEFAVTVSEAHSGLIELTAEITSRGRYTKTYIPVTLIVK